MPPFHPTWYTKYKIADLIIDYSVAEAVRHCYRL